MAYHQACKILDTMTTKVDLEDREKLVEAANT